MYDTRNWRAVASLINTEYRRIDKFSATLGGIKRIIVTDSWIILTDNYTLNICQQADARLEIIGADEHELSHLSEVQVQFVNIKVEIVSKPIKPFYLRFLYLNNSFFFHCYKSSLLTPLTKITNSELLLD